MFTEHVRAWMCSKFAYGDEPDLGRCSSAVVGKSSVACHRNDGQVLAGGLSIERQNGGRFVRPSERGTGRGHRIVAAVGVLAGLLRRARPERRAPGESVAEPVFTVEGSAVVPGAQFTVDGQTGTDLSSLPIASGDTVTMTWPAFAPAASRSASVFRWRSPSRRRSIERRRPVPAIVQLLRAGRPHVHDTGQHQHPGPECRPGALLPARRAHRSPAGSRGSGGCLLQQRPRTRRRHADLGVQRRGRAVCGAAVRDRPRHPAAAVLCTAQVRRRRVPSTPTPTSVAVQSATAPGVDRARRPAPTDVSGAR